LAREIRVRSASNASGLAPFGSSSLRIPLLSSLSNTEKPRRRPAWSCSICRNFSPNAWKVQTVSPSAALPFASFAARSRISRAALLVNVIAAILLPGTCLRAIRYAIFSVITRVLPEPAPASTSRGPSQYSTAARCGGLSPYMGRVMRESRSATAIVASGTPLPGGKSPAGRISLSHPARQA
jgi:hypothetical protein